jgi:hypothetical protein
MKFRDGSNSECVSDPVQIPEKVQWERISELYTESQNSPSLKWTREVKGKVKSVLIIFFDIKGTFHKEFGMGETVNFTVILWYLHENVEGFAPKFGDDSAHLTLLF